MERQSEPSHTESEMRQFILQEELIDVTPFSEETRMKIPDQTHAQELLEQPIPLENRIAHLLPYLEPTAEIYSRFVIARKIGSPADWVQKVALRIGIQPITNTLDEEGVESYPPYSLELLQEEWQWYQSYKELDDYLTEYAISQFVARSPQWVRKTAADLEVYPTKAVVFKRFRTVYPKTLIPQLRHLLLVYLPSEDWYITKELEEATGHDWGWVARKLKASGIQSQKRRSALNGGIFDYYPPEALEYLKQLNMDLVEPAGDWLTIQGMADKLGKSYKWVISQLADMQESPELKLSSRARDEEHYPPEVCQKLSEKSATLIEVGDYFAVDTLAKYIGKSGQWVRNRLQYTDAIPEDRVDVTGSVHEYYPPDTIEKLEGLPWDILKTQGRAGWVSVTDIAQQLGHTRSWVKNRLPYVGAVFENKTAIDIPQQNYFPPDIIEKIAALPTDVLKK
ncbi:hypothetical protein H7200_00285 [Candidatus Saccharibacteria bacterium]|nr:hypothetical protein [Candidatus Saccharibacteria bacterium]